MDNIGYFKVYPGFRPEALDLSVELGSRALVLEAYACGTLPIEGESGLEDTLKRLSSKVPIFLISGIYEPNKKGVSYELTYESEYKAINAGVIPLEFPNISNQMEIIDYLRGLFDKNLSIPEIKKQMSQKYSSKEFQTQLGL